MPNTPGLVAIFVSSKGLLLLLLRRRTHVADGSDATDFERGLCSARDYSPPDGDLVTHMFGEGLGWEAVCIQHSNYCEIAVIGQNVAAVLFIDTTGHRIAGGLRFLFGLLLLRQS